MEENTIIEIEATPDTTTEVNETVATESNGGFARGVVACMVACVAGKIIISACKHHRAGRDDRMVKHLRKKGYKVEEPEKEVVVIEQEPDEEETPKEPVKKGKNK